MLSVTLKALMLSVILLSVVMPDLPPEYINFVYNTFLSNSSIHFQGWQLFRLVRAWRCCRRKERTYGKVFG